MQVIYIYKLSGLASEIILTSISYMVSSKSKVIIC